MLAAWLLLLAAIGIEVGATSMLPRAEGFRAPGWSVAVLLGYGMSIWLLSLAVRDIPVSIAYACWAGLGTVGIAVVGYLWLNESLDAVKVGAITMIIAGVLVLNLRGTH